MQSGVELFSSGKMDESEQSFAGLTRNGLEDVNYNNTMLDCPNLTSEDKQFLEMFNYWIGGVVISCVAVPGLIMNLVAICVLLRSVSNRNNFNPLIAILCIFDSAFLALEMVDVLRKYFNAKSIVLMLLFPKFIYPLREIAFTSSIFMTVAIAYERYSAITFPFQHLQLLRSRKCRRMALIKYILVVSATAIIFNIPKFFETQVEWKNVNDINLPNQTTGLVVTKIETDSPLQKSIEPNSIILEAQKKKIKTELYQLSV